MQEQYLERDQNFFEHSPFDYLNLVAKAREVEVRRLRGLLPSVREFELKTGLSGASDEVARANIDEHQGEVDKILVTAASLGITGRLKQGSTGRPFPIYYAFRESFVEIAMFLKDSPDWYGYMREYTGQAKPWISNGEPNKRYQWFRGEQIPTYHSWFDEKAQAVILDAEARRQAILVGVADIFPQDFAGVATAHPMLKDLGRKRRHWATLRGADLIPEPGRDTMHINTKRTSTDENPTT